MDCQRTPWMAESHRKSPWVAENGRCPVATHVHGYSSCTARQRTRYPRTPHVRPLRHTRPGPSARVCAANPHVYRCPTASLTPDCVRAAAHPVVVLHAVPLGPPCLTAVCCRGRCYRHRAWWLEIIFFCFA